MLGATLNPFINNHNPKRNWDVKYLQHQQKKLVLNFSNLGLQAEPMCGGRPPSRLRTPGLSVCPSPLNLSLLSGDGGGGGGGR